MCGLHARAGRPWRTVMGGNLAKAPLTAIIFAAMMALMAQLLPVSQTYAQASAEFRMPLAGYVFLVVYGLWLSLAMALYYYHAKAKGPGALIFAAIFFLGLACVGPAADQIAFGQPTGAMTGADTWMQVIAFSVSTLFILLLGHMLMSRDPAMEQPRPKCKLQALPLTIKLIVTPFIFCILFFILWYFMVWQREPVLLYYSGGLPRAEVDFLPMLTRNVIFSLVQGLAYMLLSLPLLQQLPGKRSMFLILNALLYLSGALYWLIPQAAVPDAVRIAQLVRYGVLMLVYAVLTGIMLHTSIKAEEAEPVKPAKAARPAAVKK